MKLCVVSSFSGICRARDCVSSNELPSLSRSEVVVIICAAAAPRAVPSLKLFFAFFGLFLLCRLQCIAVVAILVAAAVSPSLLPPFSWHK